MHGFCFYYVTLEIHVIKKYFQDQNYKIMDFDKNSKLKYYPEIPKYFVENFSQQFPELGIYTYK